jgi:hypothetical protein
MFQRYYKILIRLDTILIVDLHMFQRYYKILYATISQLFKWSSQFPVPAFYLLSCIFMALLLQMQEML